MNIRRKSLMLPILDRLEVAHTKDPMSGCWIWEGTLRNGYGVMRVNKNPVAQYAHRLAYALYVGPIPDGMEVCHRCDVKCCINPSHLFIGTHRDNMLDAWNKQIVKRPPSKSGAKHHAAKLNDAMVIQIRERCRNGETQRAVAESFGVSQHNVHMIVSNKTWRHI